MSLTYHKRSQDKKHIGFHFYGFIKIKIIPEERKLGKQVRSTSIDDNVT
jgi:hypothetical protein